MTLAAYDQSDKADNVSNVLLGALGADNILSSRTVAYAAATRYADGQYTPVGVTPGIRGRF